MKAAVILPCLNEEKTVERVIKDLRREGKKAGLDLVIIGVDDASTDNSLAILRKNCDKVICFKEKKPLAEVIRKGIKASLKFNPGIIIHVDSDGQYPINELEKIVTPIKTKQADLVLGYRKIWKISHMPMLKKIGNSFFSFIVSIIIVEKIRDAQTGFRALSREFAENLKLISNYTYTQEEIIRAKKLNYKIRQAAISFKVRRHGKSRLISNVFYYGIRSLIDIIRVAIDKEE